MMFRKKFADAALKTEQVVKRNKGVLPILAVWAAGMGAIGGMEIAENIGNYDEGNVYQQEINQQYTEALNLLAEGRQTYLEEYADVLDEDARTSNVTRSIEKEFSAIFNFFDDDDDEDDPLAQAQEDWEGFKHFAGIYARDIQTDQKLSEADAQRLITRFENEVIPFKELGYAGTPDAKDLRESQAQSNDAFTINKTTIDEDFATGEQYLTFGGLGLALGLLMFLGLPLGAAGASSRNRKTLENWQKGKKTTAPRH
ncbi:MAG: hypothetical protein EP349_07525 [Alphaproteobacteria bacterium]|nr:MAG: hypothetical protein EP349_07525 [Alphaproteobacteria bacterium]